MQRGELYNKAMELQKQGRELIFTNGMWSSLSVFRRALTAGQHPLPAHVC